MQARWFRKRCQQVSGSCMASSDSSTGLIVTPTRTVFEISGELLTGELRRQPLPLRSLLVLQNRINVLHVYLETGGPSAG